MNDWNHKVTLLSLEYRSDEYGNQIQEELQTDVLCRKKSITRSEFYNAGQDGYKPSLTLVVHSYEYNNQSQVLFEGVKYKVIRSFEIDLEELELVCEVVSGVR